MEISRLEAGAESVHDETVDLASVITGILRARGWDGLVRLEAERSWSSPTRAASSGSSPISSATLSSTAVTAWTYELGPTEKAQSSRSPTTGPEYRPSTCRTCSSASTRRTRRAPRGVGPRPRDRPGERKAPGQRDRGLEPTRRGHPLHLPPLAPLVVAEPLRGRDGRGADAEQHEGAMNATTNRKAARELASRGVTGSPSPFCGIRATTCSRSPLPTRAPATGSSSPSRASERSTPSTTHSCTPPKEGLRNVARSQNVSSRSSSSSPPSSVSAAGSRSCSSPAVELALGPAPRRHVDDAAGSPDQGRRTGRGRERLDRQRADRLRRPTGSGRHVHQVHECRRRSTIPRLRTWRMLSGAPNMQNYCRRDVAWTGNEMVLWGCTQVGVRPADEHVADAAEGPVRGRDHGLDRP